MSTVLTDLIEKPNKILTARFTRWFIDHHDDPVSDKTAQIILQEMTKPKRDRIRSFSGSSSGSCIRKQHFDYYGVQTKNQQHSPQLLMIFKNGTWGHLRWQSMLLDSGIIDEIEVPLTWPAMRTRGTMDGRGTVPQDHLNPAWRGEQFGLEIKTTNSHVFARSLSEGPKEAHLNQIHRYFLMSGDKLFVVLYENKDRQEWKEWVIECDPNRLETQRAELEELNFYVDEKKLPPPLPSCLAQIGPVFNECPYGKKGGICVSVTNDLQDLKRYGAKL